MVRSQLCSWKTMVALAFSARSTSSLVVPPMTIENRAFVPDQCTLGSRTAPLASPEPATHARVRQAEATFEHATFWDRAMQVVGWWRLGASVEVARLAGPLADAPVGVALIDSLEYRYVTLNHAYAHVLGLPRRDVIGAQCDLGQRPDASMDEIIEAAKSAAAHDFILTLPQGYDTNIGEFGGRLSGGQRQRLSIARAFLKDAPILFLDEPTSALDAESDALIQEALKRLMKGRTTLMIAHRLASIAYADRIYVMEKGRVIESGSHEDLLQAKGKYAHLFELQFNV